MPVILPGDAQEFIAADVFGNLHRISVVLDNKFQSAGRTCTRLECTQLPSENFT